MTQPAILAGSPQPAAGASQAPARPKAAAESQTAPPLQVMSETTPTRLWNDSATPGELSQAIGWGAVGATCNPVIALAALQADPETWRARIRDYARTAPRITESEIGWQMVRRLSVESAALLEPIFHAHQGRNGRLSIQTDPRLHRDGTAIVEQAIEFNRLAPNMIVKIPATQTGVAAIEEATYRGVSINATVSFTLPQALAVAEAVERGLRRREAEGLDVATMGPVCTIMVGRLDDWLKVVAERRGITVDPGILEWCGVAVFKKAYRIYRERGYRTRLLSAAFRNHMHWSQLIGGDVVISPPFAWQARLNASGIEPIPRMDDPVAPHVVESLYANFAEFRHAYDEDGLAVEQFATYGATRRTLRQFLAACADLEGLVRDVVIPDPDE
ncbi:MAG TPA: transaldolase family protein [Jiangellales bacterium]|nr:transaldolase family protein [Jiangellales bacterium]